MENNDTDVGLRRASRSLSLSRSCSRGLDDLMVVLLSRSMCLSESFLIATSLIALCFLSAETVTQSLLVTAFDDVFLSWIGFTTTLLRLYELVTKFKPIGVEQLSQQRFHSPTCGDWLWITVHSPHTSFLIAPDSSC